MTDANLFAQQEANKRKSAWLVVGFVLFFAWIGFGGDLAFYLQTRGLPPNRYHHVIPFIGIVACLFAGGTARYAWVSGAKRVLNATGAQEVIDPTTPELKQLDNVVEEMAIAAGIPKPKIWIVPDPDPNAFATGHDPLTAHIAVTEGLLKILNREELQAVVAHEMSHIRNFDVRLMTLLAAMVGSIALMSDMMRRYLWYGGGRHGRSSDDRKNNPLGMIVMVLWVVTLVLAPIVATVLSMAVSRKREYLADATGAQLTRNPLALASALTKIEGCPEPTVAITKGAAHLCIVSPSAAKLNDNEGRLGNLFSSHPPMKSRLERLRGMGYTAVALLLLLLPRAAQAQMPVRTQPVDTGVLVRVTGDNDITFRGRLTSRLMPNDDTVHFCRFPGLCSKVNNPEAFRTFATSRIRKLEVQHGTRASEYGLLGVLLGGAAGWAIGSQKKINCDFQCTSAGTQSAVTGAVLAGVVGVAWGLTIQKWGTAR